VPFLSHEAGSHLTGGRFSALNRTLELGDPPGWDPDAPLLWLFNLHYFAYLTELAPERRKALVLDWIARYPPRRGRAGWMPYPLSLRLRNWAKLAFVAEGWSANERECLLASIEVQGRCLADGVEYHLGGNHLLENALTLRFLGACFRSPAAAEWARLGDEILERELDEQFLPDGGHFERSPMYHALLVHGLLDLVNILPEGGRLLGRLRERLPSLLGFLEAMRHPDGGPALFNDSALDIAPEPALLLTYGERLGIRPPVPQPSTFPETGYYVFRRGGDALVVDAGPIGPDYVPAHAHGDLFSFELSLDGRRIVVDGGTSSYEPGPERDWVRSTAAHNTVEVGGVDQCEFFDAFRVGRRARPHQVRGRVDSDGLHLSGWHDGYRRLAGRPVHAREIRFLPEGVLLVWDEVRSVRPHAVLSRLHFAPGATVEVTGDREAVLPGLGLTIRAFGGVLQREGGFHAPRFGERIPIDGLALRKGPGPEFGYALFRRGFDVEVDATGARVGGRAIGRERPPGGPE
jgi:uncharacterized heparinase superfamily protein